MTDRIHFAGKPHITQKELEAAMGIRKSLACGPKGRLFDAEESERRKEEGIARVERNDQEGWREAAYELLCALARTLPEFTADDIRAAVDGAGIGEPHHPNAYGALMRRAARKGVAEITDRTAPSARKDAHGHRNPVWRSKVRQRASEGRGGVDE